MLSNHNFKWFIASSGTDLDAKYWCDSDLIKNVTFIAVSLLQIVNSNTQIVQLSRCQNNAPLHQEHVESASCIDSCVLHACHRKIELWEQYSKSPPLVRNAS